jgi:hypothetical protein
MRCEQISRLPIRVITDANEIADGNTLKAAAELTVQTIVDGIVSSR